MGRDVKPEALTYGNDFAPSVEAGILSARGLWYTVQPPRSGRRVTVRRRLRLAVLQVLLDVMAHSVGGGFRARRQV